MTTEHYDLMIIGTGSGNSVVTPYFDDKSVAIIERDVFGGTCLNKGCIPSKMFVFAAEIAEHAALTGPRLGLDTTFNGADWPAIRDRVFGRIDPIAEGGRRYRSEEQENVTVYAGSARFTGERTVSVTIPGQQDAIVSADQVVLAAGARVWVPDAVIDSGVPFHTSDSIMRIDELPKHLIVLGGGYIGAELGNAFGALGSKVTIINRSDRMLRNEDPDISERFTKAYAEKYDIITNASVEALSSDHAGHIRVEVSIDGITSTIEGDTLLVATGRIPNGEELNVAATGVELDERGYVITDAHLRTAAPGVWALGDITHAAQLKHTSNDDARAVAHNIEHPDDLRSPDRRFIPHAVFGHPQVASAGLTEPQARAAGRNISTVVQPYGAAAYGWAMEDTDSICKLVADADTRELLGAHLIGPQASILIQQLIQGMSFGQTVDEMASGQLYIHPALSEVVEQALLGL